MIISNCLLSIVAAMLSIVGTYSCNGNLECFGWGMLFVAFVNAIGWIIATEPDEAVVAYQTTVSTIQDGVSFDQVSESEFLETFAGTTTEEMPTIERGLTNAALTIKECLFDLAQNNKTAKILAIDQALI